MSNYIFTAIFVGEMTLKVVLLHLRPLPPPAGGWGLALVQPTLGLSISNIPQGPRGPHPSVPALEFQGPKGGAVSARSLLARSSPGQINGCREAFTV